MKLLFLGTGSAFVPITDNFQSNMVLESETGKRLMIDCGSDARHALAAQNLGYRDIDYVYISHFHADHVGGLEWLAFNTYFAPNADKPSLMIHPDLLKPLWKNVLSGGLESLAGEVSASLEDYFNVVPCMNATFHWEGASLQMIPTIHIHNGMHLVPTYGLFIETSTTKAFLTTDTQYAPEQHQEYYEKADIIFQDCETTPFKSGVHAHFTELATLPAHIKKKMWLYHYHDIDAFDALPQGFAGFVKKGQVFEI